MSDHIHIIVTGAKEKARTILLSRKKLKFGLALSVGLICVAIVGAIITTRLFVENSNLNAQVSAMSLKLIESTQESRNYADRIDDLLSQTTSQTEMFEAEKEELVNKTLVEFNKRNQIIEDIMKNIGVKIKNTKPQQTVVVLLSPLNPCRKIYFFVPTRILTSCVVPL